MRRLAVRVLVALMISAGVWAILTAISAIPTTEEKHYEITDADVRVELQRDGSLVVHELLTFDFSGNFSGAYRDFPLNGSARVTNVAVFEDGERYDPGGNTTLGSYDRAGTYGFEREPGRDFRIVWHYQAANEERTFDIAYRVVNAVDVYDDVVDATWTVWGDQWDFWLDHLDASITAKSGVAPTATWFRPRTLGVDSVIDGDAATVSVDRLPQGETAGLRAVFPREAITATGGASARSGDGLGPIEDEETKLDDGYSTLERAKNFLADNVLVVCLLIGGLALLLVAVLVLVARERDTGVPKYLPEPPEDVSPALAFPLAREGEYDQRLVLATLLDLIDRGYYDSRASADVGDLDLEIRVPDERPDGVPAKYEVATIDFFDRLLGGNWVALGKLSDGIPKHSSSWRTRWESLNEQLDAAEDGEIGWDRDLRPWRVLIGVVATVALAIVLVLVFSRTHRLVIPGTAIATTLLLMAAIPANYLRRLDPTARERSARWRAFERWTADFPRLKDDPPQTLKLWRRILVYAAAFGTAERVVESGRIPPPVGEEAESSGLWVGYAFYGPGWSGSFDGFSSDFSSQVAPPPSSGGGGGGFSGGGGGGFSGGGGGGAW